MKTIATLVLVLCAGCQNARQNVGRPAALAGEKVIRTSMAVMGGMAASWVLVPVGVAIGVSGIIIGTPLYYGGNWIAGDKPGPYPNL